MHSSGEKSDVPTTLLVSVRPALVAEWPATSLGFWAVQTWLRDIFADLLEDEEIRRLPVVADTRRLNIMEFSGTAEEIHAVARRLAQSRDYTGGQLFMLTSYKKHGDKIEELASY